MSRYHIKSNGLYAILGYDRPMYSFHIAVFKDNTDEDEIVYSNLDSLNPFPRDLNILKSAANRLGLNIPQAMWDEIQSDFNNDVGNKEVSYMENGQRSSI